jgi:hypothetical protein
MLAKVPSGWVNVGRETDQRNDAYRHNDQRQREHIFPRLTLSCFTMILVETINGNWGMRF